MEHTVSITEQTVPGFRISITSKTSKQELGHAFLVIGKNDLHDEPFALLEDVQVAETSRGQGIGNMLLTCVEEKAREAGCYKLIATSRFAREHVHEWYKRRGYEQHGLEFRKNLIPRP